VVLIAPLVGFIGVLVGQVFVRGRELRETRRVAYLVWMRAGRHLASWEGDEPVSGTYTYPPPGRLHALNEATSDLNLVASRRVSEVVLAYLQAIADPNLKEAIQAATGARQAITAFDDHMKPLRADVVKEMRRDLLPWWERRWEEKSDQASGSSTPAEP
jgi:hypothetical protein